MQLPWRLEMILKGGYVAERTWLPASKKPRGLGKPFSKQSCTEGLFVIVLLSKAPSKPKAEKSTGERGRTVFIKSPGCPWMPVRRDLSTIQK